MLTDFLVALYTLLLILPIFLTTLMGLIFARINFRKYNFANFGQIREIKSS